ncbi:MAG: hypothetical protein SFY67_04805 [Candidatus Melainabacteria bacterium]|nr:hypothetical protein [Candidatus Melainabacteria bacterium]
MQNFDIPQDYNPNPTPGPNMHLEQPSLADHTNTVNSSDLFRNEFFKQNIASLMPEQNMPNPVRMDMQATFSPQGRFNPFEYSPLPNMRPNYPQQFRPQFSPQMAAYPYNQQFEPQFRPQVAAPYTHQFNQPTFDQNYDFIPHNDADDRPATARTNNPERLVRLKLDNRVGANTASADAMVYLPPGFNPNQKYDVVVFNHGFRSSAESSIREFNLIEQMKKGNPQTVLIVPEWQIQPKASNHLQGRFAQQGFFTSMLQEILQKTPELAQGGLNNIERMHLFSHSAGYTPTGSILNKNPEIASKVYSVTMLDSLYSDTVMPWLQANQQALASGEKQFRNIFGSETSSNSRNQLERLRQMMARLGRPDAVRTMDNTNTFRDARASIIFTRTRTNHGSIPNQFIANSMDHSDEA